MKDFIVSWEEIYKNIVENDFPEFDYIIAIARGGLIPATLISYKYKTNNLLTITTELYDPESNELRNNIRIKYPLSGLDISRLSKSKNILIVDDILDSGETLIAVESYLKTVIPNCPNLNFYTICKKFDGRLKIPELFDKVKSSLIIDTDCWVTFPWDISDLANSKIKEVL